MSDFNHNIDSIRIEPDNKTREVGRKDVNYVYGNPYGLPEMNTPLNYGYFPPKTGDANWVPKAPTAIPDYLQTTIMPLKKETGLRYDDGKTPYDLIPPELLEGVGQVLGYGARKYSKRNWELGMDWSRVFASLMRHAWKFWRGEKVDEETGLPHTWHMATNVAFLMAYEARGKGKDDRPVQGT